MEQCLAQQLLGGVENGAAADFLLDAPQDVLSLARRCGTAANAAQGGVRGGGEADAPEQNAAAPAPDGAGRGLAAMEERGRALGGSFRAGPGERGGWVVFASVPR